ncbi:MAG: DNA mismatch repair endonuclease MutL [Treponema sp.]|nr:DNA mismatch repair endonuclease MutL [Treponema sp.]
MEDKAAVDTAVSVSRIKLLPPEEARRIAAGEVIDRPAALIREFLDNAIDAAAANIEVTVEGGGVKKAEVVDDGEGMDREDLRLCWLTHATSKIRSLDDLNSAETLGFRGEALAAAAAVSRLEIVSSADGRDAWHLEVGPGEQYPPRLERTRRTKGSTVRSLSLYDTIPARKRFLKREGSEAALCRQAFIDKALAFPEISFRFIQDGRPLHFFPAAAAKKERFAAALLDSLTGAFLHEIHVAGEGFSADLVIGGPELCRNDRRMLYVFANGRRIQDYSLAQALEYGTQGWFPNGTHPVGAVYVDIDPALADFNIHPAKREVRFRDPGAIHHAVSSALRDFCRRHSLKTEESRRGAGNSGGMGETAAFSTGASLFGGGAAFADRAPAGRTGAAAAMEALLEKPPAFPPLPGRLPDYYGGRFAPAGEAAEEAPLYGEPRYAGRAFCLFIMVEWGTKLFIIDQHAAHERMLYNRFLSSPIPKQELLAPLPFNTESDEEDRFLEAKREELARLAVDIEKDGNTWLIQALPAGWNLGDAETVRHILDLRRAGENMAERWAATLCCHQAVRDGDYLDDASAFALAKEALALPDPHCPHGRPVWTEITRDALFKAVRRGN